MSAMAKRPARCACGDLSVVAAGEPLKISACHCHACRHRTGSAFGVAVFFPREAVKASGEARVFTRTGTSGQPLDFHFCPACGTSVLWYPAFRPGLVAIAYGCFDEPPPPPSQSVHEDSRLPWVGLDLADGQPR